MNGLTIRILRNFPPGHRLSSRSKSAMIKYPDYISARCPHRLTGGRGNPVQPPKGNLRAAVFALMSAASALSAAPFTAGNVRV